MTPRLQPPDLAIVIIPRNVLRLRGLCCSNTQCPPETTALESVQAVCKKHTFLYVATLPAFMFLCYLGLFLYFRRKGGYKPVEIDGVPASSH